MLTILPATEVDYRAMPNLWGGRTPNPYPEEQPVDRYAEGFAAIAGILEALKKEGRFEIYLLHRHFDVHPGEALLETYDPKEGAWDLQVLSTEELFTERYCPAAFKFVAPSKALGLTFLDQSLVAPLDNSDTECLRQIGEVLHQLKLSEVLGISSTHREQGRGSLQRFIESSTTPLSARRERSVPVERFPESKIATFTHYRRVKGQWVATLSCYGDGDH